MKFGPVPVEQSSGKILAHKLVGDDGQKLFGKGHIIQESDLAVLRAANLGTVIVADLESSDLHENAAARRVGEAIAGNGIRVTAPGVGRANLVAAMRGPLYVNVSLLDRLNNIDEGIAIATLREHTLIDAGDLVALVKIIPFAVAEDRVIDVEAMVRENAAALRIRPLRACSVALILSGPESAREKLMTDFIEPVRKRVENLDSVLDAVDYVSHSSRDVAAALKKRHSAHDVIVVAGISAIIDREDVVPRALELAGGTITKFGVPVDPGNLMALGYLKGTPILGAPGCVKSLKTNVVDWILPRLIAGERLTRADFVAMGHGGLLEDIHERPVPRNR